MMPSPGVSLGQLSLLVCRLHAYICYVLTYTLRQRLPSLQWER